MSSWVMILLGFGVGTFGTLIGAGGGFILVPILLLLYPERSPELITSISLAVVCLNAVSGSVAYGFSKRIDYKSAFIFCATTIPGAVLGAYATAYIPRDIFNIVFGLLLLGLSSWLLYRPVRQRTAHEHAQRRYLWPITRTITDSEGNTGTYTYDIVTAVSLSFFVGIASSMLGIGGGIIHVPAMVNLLDFPIHFATATSHFVLAFMGIAGTLIHLMNGTLKEGLTEVLFLGIGVIAGAQLGARLSHLVKGTVIIRSLAIALMIVSLRILFTSFF